MRIGTLALVTKLHSAALPPDTFLIPPFLVSPTPVLGTAERGEAQGVGLGPQGRLDPQEVLQPATRARRGLCAAHWICAQRRHPRRLCVSNPHHLFAQVRLEMGSLALNEIGKCPATGT